MRHWGVGRDDGDYYKNWERLSVKLDTDTNNSVINILEAVEEFKQRSDQDDDVTFILLSNLWDNHRYKFKYPYVPFNQWIRQYKVNYTTVVAEILVRLRPGKDTLVLQTQHLIHPNHTVVNTITPMNSVVKSIAVYLLNY